MKSENSNTGGPFSAPVRWLGAALLMLAAHSAWAGVFSVTPVRVYMTPKDRAVAITLNNDGDTPVVLQADLFTWSQKEDGEDVMTPTEDLLLSPPIIKLAPGARQVVRLAMLKPRDPLRQMTYRMILREVPEAALPANRVAVPIALALNMPVFVTPAKAAREVRCEIKGSDDSSVSVLCKNSGTAYAQIRVLDVKRDDKQLAHFEGGIYILPGASKLIKIKTAKRPGPGEATISITFDDLQSQASTSSLP
jgi:fimbrial chaperone protein